MPVAFLIFNRPGKTRQVFERIAQYRPEQLLVVADGPRNEAERALCEETRRVIDAVDWPCEVSTEFAAENMGCCDRVSSGLQWVFSRCERAIILEDDCLPDPSFFHYCAALLEYYENDLRVMHISGSSFCSKPYDGKESYFFSQIPDVWGWATWRRAFAQYDVRIKQWEEFKNGNGFRGLRFSKIESQFWTSIFNEVAAGRIDTWDYQWQFTVFANNGLTCMPRVNLISNIGWGDDATHTLGSSKVAELPSGQLEEMIYPEQTAVSRERDRDIFLKRYYQSCAPLMFCLTQEETSAMKWTKPLGLVIAEESTNLTLRKAAHKLSPMSLAWPWRKLCRWRPAQKLNALLHRLSIAGTLALSEMDSSGIANHPAIKALLASSDEPVVFDVGSGDGAFSRAALAVNPKTHVTAFDPVNEGAAATPEVHFEKAACGIETVETQGYQTLDASGKKRFSLSSVAIENLHLGQIQTKQVRCLRLDDWVFQQDMESINLLKITTGGTEFTVLKGFERRMPGNVQTIVFQFGPAQLAAKNTMLDFMKTLPEYEIYRMAPNLLHRLGAYYPITHEIYTDQFILAVLRETPFAKTCKKLAGA